jgi:tRNA threonylcarbamoyladenosine biosynthesis protein TsaB
MATILCIETATPVCSIALVQNGIVVYLEETAVSQSHASSLMEFINRSLHSAGVSLNTIDAVAISKGPGSYTGLRIGVSTAKGLCYALDKPLISIGTLKCMAIGMMKIVESDDPNILFCPMIDARRMEVYNALYDVGLNEITPVTAQIIDESSFARILSSHIVYFAGDGAEKCRQLLKFNPNARFLEHEVVSAANMAMISREAYEKNLFDDVAYFEPFYLKDFIPGKSRVKGLH